jgi:hypothetical protein
MAFRTCVYVWTTPHFQAELEIDYQRRPGRRPSRKDPGYGPSVYDVAWRLLSVSYDLGPDSFETYTADELPSGTRAGLLVAFGNLYAHDRQFAADVDETCLEHAGRMEMALAEGDY